MQPVVATPADSRRYIRHLLALDPLGGTVAEYDGAVVGARWVHPRGPVATVGPLAVDPRVAGARHRAAAARAPDRGARGAASRRCGSCTRATTRRARALPPHGVSGRRAAPRPRAARGRPTWRPGSPVRLAVGRRPAVGRPRAAGQRDARAFGASRAQSVDVYLARGRVLVAERGTNARRVRVRASAFERHRASRLRVGRRRRTSCWRSWRRSPASSAAAGSPSGRSSPPPTAGWSTGSLALRLPRASARATTWCAAAARRRRPNYVLMNGDMM